MIALSYLRSEWRFTTAMKIAKHGSIGIVLIFPRLQHDSFVSHAPGRTLKILRAFSTKLESLRGRSLDWNQ
jgi:hypothetical protein